MGDGTKKNFKDLLGLAKLPERTVQVCLRGDLRAEFEKLEAELKEAREAAGDSMAPAGVSELLERMDAIQAEMKEATYPIVLRSLGSRRFRQLRAQHPPRRTDDGKIEPEDEEMGVNVEEFAYELVKLSLVDPELDDAGYDDFMDRVNNYYFFRLYVAAVDLNGSEVDIPFSSVASQMSRDSGDESSALIGSESLAPSSTAASHSRSRSTSTKKAGSSGR